MAEKVYEGKPSRKVPKQKGYLAYLAEAVEKKRISEEAAKEAKTNWKKKVREYL